MKIITRIFISTISLFLFISCSLLSKDDKSKLNISCPQCAGLEVSLTSFNILPSGPKEIYQSTFDQFGQARIEFAHEDTLNLFFVIGNEDQGENKFSATIYFEPGANIDLVIENGVSKFNGDLKIVNSYYSKIDSIKSEGRKYVNDNLIRCIHGSNLEKKVYLDSLLQFGAEIKKQIEMDDSVSDYYQKMLINYASLFEITERMHFDTQVARIESNNNGMSVVLDSTLSTAFSDLTLHKNYVKYPIYIWYLSNRLMLIVEDILNYRYENSIEGGVYEYFKRAILQDERVSDYQELMMALVIYHMGDSIRLDYDLQLKLIDLFGRDYPHSKYLIGLNHILTDYHGLRSGEPMKDLKMRDIDGKIFTLSDLRGNILYIDVWATWCGPCLDELEYSVKLSKKYSNYPDLKFLYVSIDEDTTAWKKFLSKNSQIKGLHGIQNSEFLPDSSLVTKLYKFSGIPRYIVIDKQGNIVTTNAKFPSKLLSENYLDSLLSL